MSGLSVRTRNGSFPAELDDSDISNAIWLSLPLELTTNMLGGMAYCECPLNALMPKEGRVTELEVGDIAYWPGPGALCFFFGPTPLSGENRSERRLEDDPLPGAGFFHLGAVKAGIALSRHQDRKIHRGLLRDGRSRRQAEDRPRASVPIDSQTTGSVEPTRCSSI